MKIVFKSKKHLAKQLLKGRKFTYGMGTIMFDPDFAGNPFRYVTPTSNCPMEGVWDVDDTAWEEVEPQHIHQEFIDAYNKGAEIEFLNIDGIWYSADTPSWRKHTTYRIKPYSYPLYARNKTYGFIVKFTSLTEGIVYKDETARYPSGTLISTDTPHFDKSCWKYVQPTECWKPI
jgi:hypothetical protein